MTDADLVSATRIPLKMVQAIRSVESNGHPGAIRFEPHIFHRDRPVLALGKGDPRCVGYRAACNPSVILAEEWAHHDHHTGAEILAHADPVELAVVPYTPGPTRAASALQAETNQDAFGRAYNISPARAVRATSWGAYQVLGWALLLIYPTPANAVATFRSTPDIVSDRLFVEWCKAHPAAVAAAQRFDLASWVHAYNGAIGDSAQHYIDKMRAQLDGAQA